MSNKFRKLKTLLGVSTLAGGMFLGYELASGNERFYREWVIPAIHGCLDPERAHRCAIWSAGLGLMPMWGDSLVEYPELEVRDFAGRLTLKNPIGLAAGFDKNGAGLWGLLYKSGFGMIEIGSITPLSQPGNDLPRVFRLPDDGAVINRYGFNSDGFREVKKRVGSLLAGRKTSPQADSSRTLVGINLGKNKLEDRWIDGYVEGIREFGGVSDYMVINVSSPNTPGLRALQGKEHLIKLLKVVRTMKTKEGLSVPLFLKISPDLSFEALKDIAELSLKKDLYGIDGLIATNTTISRPDSLKSPSKSESGGLSGAPLKDLSTNVILQLFKLTQGRVPIIGVGGVASGRDAYEKIRAGASVVQLYSSLTYEGWPIVGRIKRELAQLLRDDGFERVSDAVGVDAGDRN